MWLVWKWKISKQSNRYKQLAEIRCLINLKCRVLIYSRGRISRSFYVPTVIFEQEKIRFPCRAKIEFENLVQYQLKSPSLLDSHNRLGLLELQLWMFMHLKVSRRFLNKIALKRFTGAAMLVKVLSWKFNYQYMQNENGNVIESWTECSRKFNTLPEFSVILSNSLIRDTTDIPMRQPANRYVSVPNLNYFAAERTLTCVIINKN